MKTLKEKRMELVKESGVWFSKSKNKMSVFSRIYFEVEIQEKEFIEDILNDIEKRNFSEDYTSKEFKEWMKQIIKNKSGFKE